MSDNEIISLKDDLREIKEDVKSLINSFSDYKEKVAEKYVSKEEFDKFKAENGGAHSGFIGWIIGTYGLIVATIAALIAYLKG